MIVFQLTMPNVGSWNGRWSGSDRIYCRIYPNNEIPKNVIGKDFYYSWPDGWTACVSVRKVDYREAKKLKELSAGFYGYDWMIESILKHEAIRKRNADETQKEGE